MTVAMEGGIAMITSGFPRVSETFALNELLALERAGALGAIFATKPGDGHSPQPGAETLAGRVEVLSDPRPGAQVRMWSSACAALAYARSAYFAHAGRSRRTRRGRCSASRSRSAPTRATSARSARRAHQARPRGVRRGLNTDVADDLGDRRSCRADPPRRRPQTLHADAAASRQRLELLAVGRLVEKKGLGALLKAVAGLEPPFACGSWATGRACPQRSSTPGCDRATLDGTLTTASSRRVRRCQRGRRPVDSGRRGRPRRAPQCRARGDGERTTGGERGGGDSGGGP
jgi:hypothetical protein